MRPLVVVLAAVSIASCSTDLTVPPGATVSCTAALPICPGGFACDTTLGLCLPTDLVVPQITVNEAVSHNGSLWVDTVELNLTFTLPVGAAAPVSLDVSGDVTSGSSGSYAPTATARLTTGDGDKTLRLSFADNGGGFAPSVLIALRLDTATPSNTVAVTAPVLVTGEVALPDVYVNADNLSIPFSASPGAVADDFDTYVYSTDGGVTWTPTPAPLVLSPLAQDADTPVLIRERNIFGRMTPEAQQGIATIHEDSQQPSPPGALVPQALANLSSEAGVLVSPSIDPGGGLVRYEVIGGSYTEYTSTGTRPFVRFSGVTTGELSVYLVHGVDRAGNTSTALSVPVGDTSMTATGINRTSATRYDFWSGNGMGAFMVKDNGSNAMEVCRLDGSQSCGQYDLNTTGTTQLLRTPSVFGRNVVFEDVTTQTKPIIAFIDIGPDGTLDFTHNDDSTRANLDFGHCAVAGPGGIVYGKYLSLFAYQPVLYRYGADGIANTGDAGEGSVVLSANGRIVQGNPCWTQFNGRQVLWADQRASEWYLYDLGADRIAGTADDTSERSLGGFNTAIVLGDKGMVKHTERDRSMQWVDFGADGAYGTGDDATSEHNLDDFFDQSGVAALAPAARDGKILGMIDGNAVLYDLGARSTVTLHSPLVGDGQLRNVGLGAATIFGGLQINDPVDNLDPIIPAYFQFKGEPLSYRFDSGTARGNPSGSWAGSFALLQSTRLDAVLFTNLTDGGVYTLTDAVAMADIDISPEGLMVWLDGTSLMLFSAGADKRPGTADDLGPVVVPTSGYAHWPRVANGRVVWADLSNDPDHAWTGTDVDSRLMVLDLGADGWLSTGETAVTLTAAGTKAVMPALAGNKLAYIDLTPSGQCQLANRSTTIVRASCKSQVFTIDLDTSAKTTLSATQVYHDHLRVYQDGHAVWIQDNDGTKNDLHFWDGSDHIIVAATAGVAPEADGDNFAYYANGPVVLNAGSDRQFATADDVVRRSGFGADVPFVSGFTIGDGIPYLRWLGSESLFLGAGAMPLDDTVQRYAGGSALAIADGGTLRDGIVIPGALGDLVEDMTITIAVSHAAPTDLTFTLTSPIGDVVTLRQRVAGAVSSLSFNMTNTPAMLNHWGEPIAGEWLLTITDAANGTAGTLTSWNITHRQ